MDRILLRSRSDRLQPGLGHWRCSSGGSSRRLLRSRRSCCRCWCLLLRRGRSRNRDLLRLQRWRMLRCLERIGSVTSERLPQSRKLPVNRSPNEQIVLEVTHGIPLEHVVRREGALNSAIWILVEPLHSRNLDPSLLARRSDSRRTRAARISSSFRSLSRLVRLLSSENRSLVVDSRGLGLRR